MTVIGIVGGLGPDGSIHYCRKLAVAFHFLHQKEWLGQATDHRRIDRFIWPRLLPLALLFVFAVVTVSAKADDASPRGAIPVSSPTGPDAGMYGEQLDYPVGLPYKSQVHLVGNFSHSDSFYETNTVERAAVPSPLRRAPTELSATYSYQGETRSLADYLARNPTTGLLIARDDTILFEHYQYDRTDRDRFLSNSMVKTITAMLVGIAVEEGAIRSIDDPAQAYVPALENSELGKTSIRALLHMAAGIAFSEDYSGSDDSAKLYQSLMKQGSIEAVLQFNERVAPPDTLWHYAGLNTQVLALVLSNATHMTLARYLQTRVWQPMGAEADAKWAIDHSGLEIDYGNFNATLRDYARFGLLLAHDGAWNGHQIIPYQWLLDATMPVSKGSFLALDKQEHPWGYGYQVWLMPGPRRTFILQGIHGQRIFVDPQTRLVLVHTAVRLKPNKNPAEAELIALWRSILAQADKP